MDTSQYLAAFKDARGISSDYAAAKALGVSHQAISNWVVGRSVPDAMTCFRLADALGIDPARVIADTERERAERAGREPQAAAWRAWLDKLGSVAAAFMAAAILSAGFAPGNANARADLGSPAGVDTDQSSARKSTRKRRRRAPAAQAFAHLAESLTAGAAVPAR